MRFGYKLTTIEPLEVKLFMKVTSDSLSNADFWGSRKLKIFWKSLLSHATQKNLVFLFIWDCQYKNFFFYDKMLFWTETVVWTLFRIIQQSGIKPSSFVQKNFCFFDTQQSSFNKINTWCLFHENFLHFERCYSTQFVSKYHEKELCYYLNISVYQDNRFISFQRVLMFAKPFF